MAETGLPPAVLLNAVPGDDAWIRSIDWVQELTAVFEDRAKQQELDDLTERLRRSVGR